MERAIASTIPLQKNRDSGPAANDQVGADFDAPGHIETALLEKIGVSRGSDFYLCGPSSFL
jgi:hypothetical protein